MTGRRIDLDEEGWLRLGGSVATVGVATFLAFALDVQPGVILGGLLVLVGAPTLWLWHKHLDELTNRREQRQHPSDLPHRADEAVPIRGAVDRAQDTRHG